MTLTSEITTKNTSNNNTITSQKYDKKSLNNANTNATTNANVNVNEFLTNMINDVKKNNNKEELQSLVNTLVENFGVDTIQNSINKLSGQDLDEPLLNPDNHKFTAFPLNYMDIWDLYKKQVDSFWVAEEIDFSQDYDDFQTLNDDEKYFVEMILAFFAASDGIVNFNLNERFSREVKITEAQFAYQFQMMMENIHCVSYDTQILTSNGYFKIGELLNQNVQVWNGKEFSETTIKFTGNSELYKVTLSNGMSLDCTPEHKWFITNPMTKNKDIIFTKNLSVGSVIHNYKLPVLDNVDPIKIDDPYFNGKCTDFNFVPINYSKNTKLRWLEGLYDSYGSIQFANNKSIQSINISFGNVDFLKKLQLLFTTLGTNTTIYNNTLKIQFDSIKDIVHVGFNPKKLNLKKHWLRTEEHDIKIVSIEKLSGNHDTYCFTEKNEHAGIFNGILTGQSEVYSLMLDNIVKDKKRRLFLFNAIKTVPSVKMMADWAFKWINSSKTFAHRLVAFAIVEGVFFSGAFASIFWLKKYKNKGKAFMNGLVMSNKFISRDEGLHTMYACALYKHLKNKLPESVVVEIMIEAVQISKNFMIEAIPVRLIGMNNILMSDYIEYIGDRLLNMLGYSKKFNKKNPFKFMDTIGLNDKTNFFEKRPHEYQKAHTKENTRGKKLSKIDENDIDDLDF